MRSWKDAVAALPQALRRWMRDHSFELCLFALAAAFYLAIGRATPSDVDEGYYSLAAELTARGRVPYRDFFYPQAPLLPYLLSLFVRVLGAKLTTLRCVMALFGAGTTALVAAAVRREVASRVVAAVAAALVCFHELSWQWIPAVKTYAVAGFFGTLALVLVTGRRAPSFARCVVAGVVAMVAVGVRLLFAPVAAAVVLTAALRGSPASGPRALAVGAVALPVLMASPQRPLYLAFALLASAAAVFVVPRPRDALVRGAGVAVGMGVVAAAVWLLIYRRAPEAFVFNNVGYHALRAQGGLYSSWPEITDMVFALTGLRQVLDRVATGPQFVLLLVLTVAALISPNDGRRAGPAVAALWLGVANLRPNPIFEQYFVSLVPLLAWCGCCALGGGSVLEAGSRTVRRHALALAVVPVYFALALPGWHRKWAEGFYGPWDMKMFRPAIIDAGAAETVAAARAHPGPVLPLWPGSALGVADRVLSGFENHFARLAAPGLSADQRARLHVPLVDDVFAAVSARVPSVVVIDREIDRTGGGALRQQLSASGYRPTGRTVGMTEVFVRSE